MTGPGHVRACSPAAQTTQPMTNSTGEKPLGGLRAQAQSRRSTRERLLISLQTQVGTRGYQETSVASLCQQTGIARSSFYHHFSSKEDAFVALLTEIATRLTRVIDRDTRTEAESPWTIRVVETLRCVLTFFTDSPILARIVFVETQIVGPRAQRAVLKHAHVLAPCPAADEQVALLTSLDRARVQHTLGAIYFRIYEQVKSADSMAAQSLLVELAELALTPYLGSEQAEVAANG